MVDQNEAQELLSSRHAVYGDRKKNMADVAQVWSGILGTEVRPDQVPLLMSGYKLVRASTTPDYSDNIDDADGYNEMFREIIGDDMVHARNTDEYIDQKERRKTKQAPLHPLEQAAQEELAKRERAYNSTVDAAEQEDRQARTAAKAAVGGVPVGAYASGKSALIKQLEQDVPSYSPLTPKSAQSHLRFYHDQLTIIFQGLGLGNEADSAASEATEFFWNTFQENKMLREKMAWWEYRDEQ